MKSTTDQCECASDLARASDALDGVPTAGECVVTSIYNAEGDSPASKAMREPCPDDAGTPSSASGGKTGTFGVLTPREAAERRWAGHRERSEADEGSEARILAALRRKAEAGDIAAARELRAWLDRDQEEGDTPTERVVSKEDRDAVLDMLIEQARAARAFQAPPEGGPPTPTPTPAE